MALNVGTLVAHLKLDTTSFTTGMAGAKSGAGSFVGTVTKTLGKLILPIAAIGTAFAAASTVAIMSASDIEKKFTEVFTLIPGKSQEFYDEMTEQGKQFAMDMGAGLTDVGSGMYQAISAGVPEEDVFPFLKTAQQAAVGGVSDLETAVDGLTSVVNAYGSDVISASEASDLIFTTVKAGKTNFEEMSRYLFQVIPTAAAMGISFDQVTASLATMTAAGTPTRVAATGLRQVISELSKEGQVANKWFTKITGESFPNFIKNGGDVGSALQKMNQFAVDNDMSMIDMFGSIEAGNAALQMSGKNADTFAQNLEAMRSSTGSTEEAFNTMEQTFSRRMDKIKAKFEVTIVNLGETLIPHVEKILDWWDENGEGLISPFVDAFKEMQSWWDGNGSDIIGSIIDTFQWLADTFQPIFDAYANFWSDKANLMSEWWEENGEMIIAAATNVGNAIKWVIEGIVQIWEWVWPYLEGVLGSFIDVILNVVTLFAALLTGDWEAAGDALINITLGLMDMMFGVVSLGFDAIAAGVEFVMNGISQFITDIWAGIVQVFEDAINGVIDMINGLIEAVNSVSGEIGITFDTISKVSFDTSSFEAEQYTIPRVSEMGISPSELYNKMSETETGGITQNITINNPKSSTAAETSKEYKKAAITLGTTATGA